MTCKSKEENAEVLGQQFLRERAVKGLQNQTESERIWAAKIF